MPSYVPCRHHRAGRGADLNKEKVRDAVVSYGRRIDLLGAITVRSGARHVGAKTWAAPEGRSLPRDQPAGRSIPAPLEALAFAGGCIAGETRAMASYFGTGATHPFGSVSRLALFGLSQNSLGW